MPRSNQTEEPPVDPGLVALLRGAELLSGLLDDDLSYVASRAESLSFARGEAVFSPGERARRFFIVKSGEVLVYRAGEGGRVDEMARYLSGDVIGDFDFARGAVLDASATAVEDSELVVFPGSGYSLDALALERPDATARLLLRSLAMIASRTRSTERLISENAPWVRELRRRVYTDPGTGLWSAAFLDEAIPASLAEPSAIVMMKPDRFKELVDAHGHAAGDAAMSRIAAMLEREARTLRRGWALRLRSNETAIVVPACAETEAVEIARRVARAIQALDISDAIGGETFRFTSSVSVGVWPDDCPDWRRLVEHAYGVLMRAWRDGGSRIYRARSADRESRGAVP
ncbi:MAG: diguanylate cyclase [Spirochaetes bacterium]|nr:diguanylate cyclase [Spirochaetota bacterium]